MPDVPLRDMAVGPSRHLVKFVECDGALWALKELPPRIAVREYDVLGRIEELHLNAVRRAGVVRQPDFDTAILLTRYLEGSWQYRRLFLRLPPDAPKQRSRLLDGMASLLVELHRRGVFWGDCSLANTLFSRDGQVLQASLVDAETSEVHPHLSDGQRELDVDVTVENVAAGLMDIAARIDGGTALRDQLIGEAVSLRTRYEALWELLHDEPVFAYADRHRVEGRIRKLNELGFAVDEVSLQHAESGSDQLRLKVAVGDRNYHAGQLRDLAGIDVGEGQATHLLGDLQAYQAQLCSEAGHDVDLPYRRPAVADGARQTDDVPGPRGGRAPGHRDPGLLRSARGALVALGAGGPRRRHRAGADRVGARRSYPADSAAQLMVVETPTEPFSILDDAD